jgi:hypothetical protein
MEYERINYNFHILLIIILFFDYFKDILMFFIYFDNGIGDFCLFSQKLFVCSILPSPDTLFVEQKDY